MLSSLVGKCGDKWSWWHYASCEALEKVSWCSWELISCEESLSTGVVFVSSLWCIWPNLGKLRNWRIWNYVCCCCLRGKRVRGRGRISVLATWINERNERFAWLIGIKVSGSMINCMRWGVGVWCLASLGWNYDSHEGEITSGREEWEGVGIFLT
jgi:hypothetical protein